MTDSRLNLTPLESTLNYESPRIPMSETCHNIIGLSEKPNDSEGLPPGIVGSAYALLVVMAKTTWFTCQVFFDDGTMQTWDARTLDEGTKQIQVTLADYKDAISGRIIKRGEILVDIRRPV